MNHGVSNRINTKLKRVLAALDTDITTLGQTVSSTHQTDIEYVHLLLQQTDQRDNEAVKRTIVRINYILSRLKVRDNRIKQLVRKIIEKSTLDDDDDDDDESVMLLRIKFQILAYLTVIDDVGSIGNELKQLQQQLNGAKNKQEIKEILGLINSELSELHFRGNTVQRTLTNIAIRKSQQFRHDNNVTKQLASSKAPKERIQCNARDVQWVEDLPDVNKATIKEKIQDANWHYGGNFNKPGVLAYIDKLINPHALRTSRNTMTYEQIKDCICWYQKSGYCFTPSSSDTRKKCVPVQKRNNCHVANTYKVVTDDHGNKTVRDAHNGKIIHYLPTPLYDNEEKDFLKRLVVPLTPSKTQTDHSSDVVSDVVVPPNSDVVVPPNSNVVVPPNSDVDVPRNSDDLEDPFDVEDPFSTVPLIVDSIGEDKIRDVLHTASEKFDGDLNQSVPYITSALQCTSEQSQEIIDWFLNIGYTGQKRHKHKYRAYTGVVRLVTLVKSSSKGVVASLLREKNPRKLVQTDQSAATYTFMVRGGDHPKLSSIAASDVSVVDIEFMDNPPELFHNCLIQVKYPGTGWWTGRYFEEATSDDKLRQVKVQYDQRIAKLKKEKEELRKQRYRLTDKREWNQKNQQVQDKKQEITKTKEEGSIEYRTLQRGTYVIEDHPNTGSDTIDITPFDSVEDEWRFLPCPIIEMDSEIAILQDDGTWQEANVTQLGQTGEVFDALAHTVLYETDAVDLHGKRVVFLLDTWLQQYKFINSEKVSDDEYTPIGGELRTDEYIHHVGEQVSYVGHEWEVVAIFDNGLSEIKYQIKYLDKERTLTADDFEHEWQPAFDKGHQVVYNDSVCTVVDIDHDNGTYTIETGFEALRLFRVANADKDKQKLASKIEKMEEDLEKLEKERDAIPLDEIQTGRNVELLSLMKTTTQKIKSAYKELNVQTKTMKNLRKAIRNGVSTITAVPEDQISEMLEMEYEVGVHVAYDYNICQIISQNHVDSSYMLDCGDTVTDTELNQWCMVEEKDGSHTIWRIVGHTAKRFKLFNPKWENNVDSNPNWTNSKHKKKREIELTSKNVTEQVGVDAFYTDKVGKEAKDSDNGSEVIEFAPGDTVVVGSDYIGTIIDKIPGTTIEHDAYRIRIDSHQPTPWYLPTAAVSLSAKVKTGTIGVYHVSEIDYPTTEQSENVDEQVKVDDVVLHLGVPWVVTDIVGNVVHWERMEETDLQMSSTDEEVEESEHSDSELEAEDSEFLWEPEFKEGDKVFVGETEKTVVAIDQQHEKYVLSDGQSYTEAQLDEYHGHQLDMEQSSGSDEDDDL